VLREANIEMDRRTATAHNENPPPSAKPEQHDGFHSLVLREATHKIATSYSGLPSFQAREAVRLPRRSGVKKAIQVSKRLF
jgi:hypothetical protein